VSKRIKEKERNKGTKQKQEWHKESRSKTLIVPAIGALRRQSHGIVSSVLQANIIRIAVLSMLAFPSTNQLRCDC